MKFKAKVTILSFHLIIALLHVVFIFIDFLGIYLRRNFLILFSLIVFVPACQISDRMPTSFSNLPKWFIAAEAPSLRLCSLGIFLIQSYNQIVPFTVIHWHNANSAIDYHSVINRYIACLDVFLVLIIGIIQYIKVGKYWLKIYGVIPTSEILKTL